MVVLTDSRENVHEVRASENVHEVRATDERQLLPNNVMEIFHDRHTVSNKNDDANIKIENEKDAVAKHLKNAKNDELNNDVTDREKEKVHGDAYKNQIQEEHCSHVSTEGASERLLKNRANSLDLHQKKNLPDDESSSNTEDDSQSTKDDDGLPIDKGWAWVILLASVYAHFIAIGQLKCFGIIFVQLQLRYGSSSSATSLIYTFMNASYSISALIIMTVGGSLSARTAVFIGAIISSVASMITAFIYDVNIALVTIGIASGIANAFIMPLVATIISTYFVEKRGFANNVGNCGVSLGSIALAPIVTKLFQHYSYTGTYIILTGLNLQMFIIACLFRPMSYYTRETSSRQSASKNIETEKTAKKSKENSKGSCDENISNGTITRNLLKTRLIEKHLRVGRQVSETVNGQKLNIRRRRTVSESESGNQLKQEEFLHSSVQSLFSSTRARFASTDVMNNSLMDITLIEIVNQNEEKDSVHALDKQSLKSTIVKSLKKLFDMKLLSKLEFQYFLVCNAFLCGGSSLATAYLPPLAYDNGINYDMVALLVSIMSIVDFFSKFLVGYISDRKWCHRSTLISIAAFIVGVAAQFLHLMTTFSTLMIYALIAGLLQGVYFSLFVVVILDILSFEDFKGALGFTSLIQGVASGICLQISGYLRDTTGAYSYAYNFIGAVLLVGAVLAYFIPNVHEWSTRREKRKNNDQIA